MRFRRKCVPALVLWCLLSSGCAKCLPVPEADASPPSATLIIDYRQPGGSRINRTRGAGDPDTTVIASRSDIIVVVYGGQDQQGLKEAALACELFRFTPMTTTQTLVPAIRQEVGCPKENIVAHYKFDPRGTQWDQARFTASVRNWLGTSARTGRITVRLQ